MTEVAAPDCRLPIAALFPLAYSLFPLPMTNLTQLRRAERITGSFTVNGESHEILYSEHKTLLEVLREDLGLTGTKHGCELGECGTCTVLIDGVPVLSCLALARAHEGEEITTVEGMSEGPDAASAAGGVRGDGRGAVRVLHAGYPHGSTGFTGRNTIATA